MIDLEPATQRMARLIESISDDQLGGPTPCADTSLGDLVDHVRTLTLVFTAVAKKEDGSQSPSADASKLGDDWRTRIPADLALLADAWRDPDAWSGMTSGGGVEMPGEVAGIVTLDELVIHGWDIARASGQEYDVDQESLEAVQGFVAPLADPGNEAQREGLFGPVVPVPDGVPLLDQVIGLTGRDPNWSPE
jgi:uncharacterized protein (TIGR03086 family)